MTTSITDALAGARSFFLAGVMQGSRRGEQMADQSYRARLGELILSSRPDAELRDPGRLMAEWVGGRAAELRAAHARLASLEVIDRTKLDGAVGDLTEIFARLVRLSATSDVCVAWLPDHEASMGTAVEMSAAHDAGRTVVAITPMRQNLAVLSCSSIIVPDLDHFAALLGGLDERADRARPAVGSGTSGGLRG